ncbi:MAG: hypothetical protein R3E66_19230 [bacterium]
MFRNSSIIALIALAFAAGCDDKATSTSNNNTNNGVDAGGDASADADSRDPVEQILPSTNARVKFKGGQRWASQLARGLDLERSELCKEFGEYDCAADVHFIALGGVEPYNLRINEPLPNAPLTAPIAADRIALSACGLRAERDAANPADASLFKEIAAAPADEALRAMGNRLYQQLLSRDAQNDELDELVAFWADVEDAGADAASEWATFSCYAVATSTEMLFY